MKNPIPAGTIPTSIPNPFPCQKPAPAGGGVKKQTPGFGAPLIPSKV